MGRRKKIAVVDEEPKVYVPAVEDTYGFERTMDALHSRHFSAERVGGVVYVRLKTEDDFDALYSEVERIIVGQKFRGSWGVSY